VERQPSQQERVRDGDVDAPDAVAVAQEEGLAQAALLEAEDEVDEEAAEDEEEVVGGALLASPSAMMTSTWRPALCLESNSIMSLA